MHGAKVDAETQGNLGVAHGIFRQADESECDSQLAERQLGSDPVAQDLKGRRRPEETPECTATPTRHCACNAGSKDSGGGRPEARTDD